MKSPIPDIGKNIRFLRRSRNWTLAELARKIGIQEGPLGRIELGKNAPSAPVIYNLAQALDVSVDVLFVPDARHVEIKTKDIDAFSDFIAIHPEPEKIPRQLLTATHEIMAAFHALEDICNVPKYATLPLSVPFNPDYPGMENLARTIRNYLGIHDGVVFDYFELFENAGLRVIIFQFPRDSIKMDSFSVYEPLYQNAFFFLNSKNNPERMLFSLSQELGALLISSQARLQKTELFEPSSQTPENSRPINTKHAAERFAATFLMPEAAVRATVSQLGIAAHGWSWELLLRIKHRFGISAQTFLYRLDELQLITPGAKEQLEARIKEFYKSTGFQEPDSTRRCLTPNGRFFDLLLTARGIPSARKEVENIKAMAKENKLVKN